MAKNFFIAVSGTMGVGKTTVSRLLAKKLEFTLLKENFVENKFLARFYEDMPRWAFHSQTFFLIKKIRQTQTVKDLLSKSLIVQDTAINQDVLCYAKAQLVDGNMEQAEYNLYQKIYQTFKKYLIKPDLHIYLKASIDTLMHRISNRAREEEEDIEKEYVQLLDRLNNQWIEKIPDEKKLYIDAEENNFIKDKQAIDYLLGKVEKKVKELEIQEKLF